MRIAPVVVCVMPPNGQGGGSGVLISPDGYAISNYHVTSGSGDFMKCGLNDGNVYDAVIVGIDPTGDVALIKLLGRDDFPACTPGKSDQVKMGDEVVALGNPFLLAADFTPTVTYGIVSGIRRYQYPAGTFLEYTDCIQIDASINPGNSGGPLFDINGSWIGINGRASFEKRGRINTGAAYAISTRQVLLFLNHLKSGRIVDHARTEFTVLTDDEGLVKIDQISQLSEPWRRGAREGDELLSFAGRALSSANDFKNVLGILPEGTRVPLTYRNKEGVHKTTVRLLPLHGFEEAPELPEERRPERPPRPDEDEDDKPDEQSRRTLEKPAVPKEYAHLLEKKKGYANFHFNQEHQNRLLNPLDSKVNRLAVPGNWVMNVSIKNQDTGRKTGELGVGEKAAYLQFEGGGIALQPRNEFDVTNESKQFPGLLAGMLQLHKFLQHSRTDFDEVFYHGDETLAPSGDHVETVITTDNTIKSRWYFQAGVTLPVGVDVHMDAGNDEARLRFQQWNTDENVFPKRIGLVDPDTETVNWIDIDSFETKSSGATKTAKRSRDEVTS